MQKVNVKEHSNLHTMKVVDSDHQPSWLNPYQAEPSSFAVLEVKASRMNQFVSLDMSEHNGSKSSKRTMMTLDREAALQLRDFLVKALGEA